MTLLYYDPIFLEHQTGSHPENAERFRSVVPHLRFITLDSLCKRPSWDAASVEQLCYVHDREYVDMVRGFAELGGGHLDQDTVVSKKSYEVARMAAGSVCDAVHRVLSGEDVTAFCLVRPPGHHATRNQAMGFCLFNNVAVGARVATKEHGIERVLIVDFDVHHGNGTQAIFWEDADVGFFSMHRSEFYPGTGAADEFGCGAGLGTTLNLPISFGTPGVEQLSMFRHHLNQFAKRMKPQLVLLSAGFDSHRHDPIGSLGLESEDFRSLTHYVLEVADQYAGGKLVSVLEGGYNPDALTDCITVHLEELLGHS